MIDTGRYILLDAARMEDEMDTAKKMNSEFDSLYRGLSQEKMSNVAPYLFSFRANTPFSDWYSEKGLGKSWGVIVEGNISFEACWKHFRKFLFVKTEDGKELYFRFYDPRALKTFLPSCADNQILEFFGPVEKFLMEGNEQRESIVFTHRHGILNREIISGLARS
jgi:hypothetical protein